MRLPGPPIPEGSKPAVGLCYAGGSGFGTSSCAANLDKILGECNFDVVDMILVRRQNLEMKLPYLEAVGRWLNTSLHLVRFRHPDWISIERDIATFRSFHADE